MNRNFFEKRKGIEQRQKRRDEIKGEIGVGHHGSQLNSCNKNEVMEITKMSINKMNSLQTIAKQNDLSYEHLINQRDNKIFRL